MTRRDLYMPHLPKHSDAATVWNVPAGRAWWRFDPPRNFSGLGEESSTTGISYLDKIIDPALERVRAEAGEGARAQVEPLIKLGLGATALAVGLSVTSLLVAIAAFRRKR